MKATTVTSKAIQDVIRGMQVVDWEKRIYPTGRTKVYLRFEKLEKPVTVKVV